jgi:hypothetical protein
VQALHPFDSVIAIYCAISRYPVGSLTGAAEYNQPPKLCEPFIFYNSIA